MKEIPKLQTAFLPLIYNRELNMATSLPIDRTYNVRFPYNINVTKKRTHFASKSPRTSRRALNVQPYYINAGDLVTAAIGPLNVASPGQHIGAIRDANLQRKDENTTWAGNYFRSLMRGNSGWVTPEYAEEHPLASLAWNVGGDALTLGGPKAILYLTKMDMPRYGLTPTTDYYFKPGYLGANGGNPIGKVPKEIPLEFSPTLISDGRWVINDPLNKGKRILWDKYLERIGQKVESNLEVKSALPFKHKFSNNAGKVWDKQDIISYVKQQIRRNPTNQEFEEFIRGNGLEEIRLPNGGYGILEKNEGSIFNGINDIINPPRPVPKAERTISLLSNLGLTLPQAGKFGYTLDTRNGLPRYTFLDLFASKGKLRGGQEAFNRMRSSFSGEHGKVNWTPENDLERASAILRTHFNGNPGETAVDAYTHLTILNPDGTEKVLSPIQAIIAENPYGVSGTYSNAIDGEFSIDSYLLMLKNLLRAKIKGLNLERTRYNTIDSKMNPITYSDTFVPNNFSTKIAYNTDNISPEFLNILRNYYKGSSESLIPRELPNGTTVRRTNEGLEILYNGKSLGYITRNSDKNISKILTDEINKTNEVLGLKGSDKLSLPTIGENGELILSNPLFVIFNKGGKINNGLYSFRFNKSNFNN